MRTFRGAVAAIGINDLGKNGGGRQRNARTLASVTAVVNRPIDVQRGIYR